jgi:hypothetical protein
MIIKLTTISGAIYINTEHIIWWVAREVTGSYIALSSGGTIEVKESPEVIRSKIPQEN